MHSISEVIKHFEINVPSLPHPVKGKIVRNVSEDNDISYTWSISHYYKPSAGAGIYFPSHVTSRSLEDAEQDFRAYAESFVSTYEVRANERF